jgi:hypothetical protein
MPNARLRKQNDIAKRNPANLLPPSTPSLRTATSSEQYAQIKSIYKAKKRPKLGWRSNQGVDPFDDVFISPVERGEQNDAAVERGEGYYDEEGVYDQFSESDGEEGKDRGVNENRFAVLAREDVEYFVHSLGPDSPLMATFKVPLSISQC